MQRMQQPGRDIQDSLQYIHNPTLILWGEKDRWIPVQQAYKLHQLISASKLIIFEDAGHIPMEEIPLATADSTLQFLRNNTVIRK
jgi:pimeloyl-ACP methyl ester carboxylesterase